MTKPEDNDQGRGQDIQETAEAAVLIRLLLLLLLDLLLGLGGSGGGGSSGRVSIGVRDAVLELVDLGPAVLGADGNSKNVLVAVDHGVDDGRQAGEASGQGDAGNGLDGALDGLEELVVGDIEDLRGEGVAVVVHLHDGKTVGEGGDVQHVKEGGLGGTDLGVGLDELKIGGDLNSTTGDLGGDTESLEERGLAGLHAGVASGDPHISGGDGTSTGGSRDTVVEDLVADILEVAVGEDEADVAADEGEETLPLRSLRDEGAQSTADLERRPRSDNSRSTGGQHPWLSSAWADVKLGRYIP